jgi:hypothetical protein
MDNNADLNASHAAEGMRDFIRKHPQPHRPHWRDLPKFRTEDEARRQFGRPRKQ